MKISMGRKSGKNYSILIGIFIAVISTIFSSSIVYAGTTKTNDVIVDIEVSGDNNGQVKAGSEIEILYKLSNLKNLYAASMELTYDNSLIKVNSIEPCISGSIYEAYRDTAKDGNKARYAFTFLGSDEMGISGKSDFVKMKASVLKDGELDVKGNKSSYQMVNKINNNMEEVKTVYMNSQGETVKIEKVEAEKKEPSLNNSSNTNNNDNNEENTKNSSNGSDEKKVTVLGTNNSAKAVSEDEADSNEVKNESTDNENTSNTVDENGENITSEDMAKDSGEQNQADESSEDNEEENKDEALDNEKGNSKIIVIGSIILIIAVIGILGVYTKRKKA